LLQLRDAERALDPPLLMSGIHARAREMDVCVDEARDHGAAAEIDRRKRRVELDPGADRMNTAVRDQQRVADDAAVVDEAAVGQREIRRGERARDDLGRAELRRRRAGERADAERDAGFEERSTAQGLIATGNPDFTHRRPLSVVMDSLPSAYTHSRFRVSLANKEGNSDENNKARFLVVGRGVTGRARLERLGAGG